MPLAPEVIVSQPESLDAVQLQLLTVAKTPTLPLVAAEPDAALGTDKVKVQVGVGGGSGATAVTTRVNAWAAVWLWLSVT